MLPLPSKRHPSDVVAEPFQRCHSADAIVQALRERGAPDTAYFLCEPFFQREPHGFQDNEGELLAGINELYGRDIGFLVFCIPGRLAYYEGEWTEGRYLLAAP